MPNPSKNGTAKIMVEEIQTPNPEKTPNEETPTGKLEGTGTEGGEPAEGTEDYKKKFSESSREAQRLFEENKVLKAESEQTNVRLAELEQIEEEKQRLLEEENPDAAKIHKLEKSIDEVKKSILLEKEDKDVSSFISSESRAVASKEALKRLMRVNPFKSPKELWEENFLPAIETAVKSKAGKGAGQPETGKGSMSGEPIAELELEEFNKLPLEKRKAYFKRIGL